MIVAYYPVMNTQKTFHPLLFCNIQVDSDIDTLKSESSVPNISFAEFIPM